MSLNILLAILEEKKIITNEEAEKIADGFSIGIQPSRYKDAKSEVQKLLAEK